MKHLLKYVPTNPNNAVVPTNPMVGLNELMTRIPKVLKKVALSALTMYYTL